MSLIGNLERIIVQLGLTAPAGWDPDSPLPPVVIADDADLARYIDHTALKADTTEAQIRVLCAEAAEYGFATVCVNPCWVALAAECLAGSKSGICTVIGFPLGANTSAIKAAETRQAIRDGATEVDMVIAVGRAKSADWKAIYADIREVVVAAERTPVKVILETALLSKEEIAAASLCALLAGAAFVKTSTGFSTGGATVENIALMKSIVRDLAQVKASGGVRSRETALAMIRAGATRIGTSSSLAIVGKGAAGTGY